MARAMALTNSIRAQAQINSRDILIPLEYAEKYQVQLRDLVEKKKSKELEDLIFDLASRANANVTKVIQLKVLRILFFREYFFLYRENIK